MRMQAKLICTLSLRFIRELLCPRGWHSRKREGEQDRWQRLLGMEKYTYEDKYIALNQKEIGGNRINVHREGLKRQVGLTELPFLIRYKQGGISSVER